MSFLTADPTILPDQIMIVCENRTNTANGAEVTAFDDVSLVIKTGKVLSVDLTAKTTKVSRIRFRWNKKTKTDIKIKGDAWERSYGDLEYRAIVPERVLPWYYIATDGYNTTAAGVLTSPDSLCSWLVDSDGVTLTLDVRCGGTGVELNGKTLHCADIISGTYTAVSPFEAEREFCVRMAHGSAVLPDKPVYGANNWYYAYGNSSHKEILQDSRLLAMLTQGLENRPFMVIDDGWERDRGCGGPWREGNEAFPDMAALASEMAAIDVIPGIWFRPLNNHILPEEWRLSRDSAYLDPSIPEALEYIAGDVSTFCDWGYKLIKYDFSSFDILGSWGFQMGGNPTRDGWSFRDKSKTTAQVIKSLYKTIYDAAYGRALILGCNCIGHLGVGYMHMNRTGDDTSGLAWERTRRMGVNTLAFRMCQHKSFFDIDADCVGITGNIPWKLNSEWMKLLSSSGTPLFVSVKPEILTDEQKFELSAAYKRASISQDKTYPLGITGNTCPADWNINGEIVHFCFNNEFGAWKNA